MMLIVTWLPNDSHLYLLVPSYAKLNVLLPGLGSRYKEKTVTAGTDKGTNHHKALCNVVMYDYVCMYACMWCQLVHS